MKKVLITLIIAFSGIFTANAQVWIGGSAGAQLKSGFTVSVAPEIGYSFNNSPFSIATSLNLILTGNEGSSHVYWGLIASPYVRYNLCTVGEKFNIFMDLTGDFVIPDGGYRVGLQPGIAWMATKHWTAAARIGFMGYNQSDFYGDKGLELSFQAAIPTIGLYYNF